MNKLMKFIGLLMLFTISVSAKEPVIGGPCQGCELVFVDMPASLSSHGEIATQEEPGERLLVTGTVHNLDNTPAANVIVYAYQTNALGVYPKGKTQHGKLRGWAKTDTSGKYSFKTIRPAAYSGGSEPQHIHFHVIEQNKGTYYIDALTFLDDPLLTKERKRPKCRGGCGANLPKKNEQGIRSIQRNIILGAEIPNY